MTVQHKSLRDEVLFIIGRSSSQLDSSQIYERCELAEEVKRVSDALWVLRTEGKIAFAEGEGRKRYVLAKGTATPAPAGKAGRQAAAPAPTTGDAAATLPVIDIPTLADPGISLDGTAGKAQRGPAKKSKFAGAADAGKVMLRGIDVDASAARLADAMIAKSRVQLSAPPIRWWIDQDGGLEIAAPGNDDTVALSREQAARMAEAVLAVHDQMGAP